MKHHQKAAQYAIEVVEGDIVACKAVTQACQRFINDLEKQEKAKYPYYFDVSSADHVCEFIEVLPHTKGPWAAKKQRLTLVLRPQMPFWGVALCEVWHFDGFSAMVVPTCVM